jgi:hypothetical protein
MGRSRKALRPGLCSVCFLPVLRLTASYGAKVEVIHDATLGQALAACVLQGVVPTHQAQL